ncbi:MAG: Na+/H+ antiporter NhaC family protein [Xanthomonadales bacterium]
MSTDLLINNAGIIGHNAPSLAGTDFDPIARTFDVNSLGPMRVTQALVPWHTCGAFMAAALSVPMLAYAPFAFVNLLSPVIAIIYGIINFKIVRLEEAEGKAAPA